MTRLVQFANNAVSRLAANVSSSGTSVSVTPGEGAKFPALSGSKFFMATLIRADGTTEVVKVTARSTDTLTIARAAEPVGGASISYSFSAGDRIEQRLTAAALSNELDRLDAGAIIGVLNKSANYTVAAADVSTLVRVTTTSGTISISLPEISTLTEDFDIIIAKVTSDANTVSIVRSGTTDLINGAASATIFNQYQSAWLIADRSTGTWTVISSGSNAVNTVADAGTGNGVATTVTLSGDPASKNNVAFFVGGVYQQKATFSLSGTTLTPGATIANGVTWEAVWSSPLAIGTPSDGTVTTAKLADLAVTTAKLAASAVTYAKMQSVTAGKVLGRDTSGAGVVQELPIAVDTGGGVGIGTSLALNKSAKLRVLADSSLSYQVAELYAQGASYKSYVSLSNDNGLVSIGADNSDIVFTTTTSQTERARITSGGQRKSTIIGGGGGLWNAYDCRAWVNFSGTGTVAIRDSGNVSSITDNGVGDYTVNLTTAMPDANYAICCARNNQNVNTNCNTNVGNISAPTTSSFRLGQFENGSITDIAYQYFSIFR